ncbi:EF hand, partial [Oesophagostomum dentatum]
MEKIVLDCKQVRLLLLCEFGKKGNARVAQILEIINDVDIDGNGQVEFPEFCVMMKSRPPTLSWQVSSRARGYSSALLKHLAKMFAKSQLTRAFTGEKRMSQLTE